MINKCQTVTLTKKRFSDFELVDPTTKAASDQIYLAGYLEQSDGIKKNVKIHSSIFMNAKMGEVIENVSPDMGDSSPSITVDYGVYQDEQIVVMAVNYQGTIDFLQFNAFDNRMWNIIDGKKYICMKLSPNMPLGSVYRLYFPNFPFDRGLALFPKSQVSVSEDEPIEVFFNSTYPSNQSMNYDYYVTTIHLADPQQTGGGEIVMKTKIISVLNIENFD